MARLLLEYGAEIDAADGQGLTPLHHAAAQGQVEMIGWLLDHGASRLTYSPTLGSPLHLAARAGHQDAVRLLLYRGADVRTMNDTGHTAQDVAQEYGHMALAEYLERFLEQDTCPEWMSRISESAAAGEEYFRHHREDLNRVRYHGHTPLGFAAHYGDRERVAALLRLGAELSPHAAIVMGWREHVEGWVRNNPLRVSARSAEARDMPLLCIAAVCGDVQMARFLLDHGADVNGSHMFGATALFHAAEKGLEAMVRFLVDHGADVNAATKYGLTALHRAAYHGHLPIAQALVAAGANPRAVSRDFESVMDAARQGGNDELITWLHKWEGTRR